MKKLLLIGLILAGVSCSTSKKTKMSANENTMPTGKWTLVEMSGKTELAKLFQVEMPYFELNTEDSSLSGFAGCNRFFGKFKMSNGLIVENGPLGMTKMYCQDNGEDEFIKHFNSANSYELKKGVLTLLVDKEAVLRFSQK